MDRQSIIGLVVIALLLVGYTIFTRPSEEEREELKRKRDSIVKAEEQKRIADSLRQVEMEKADQNADSLDKSETDFSGDKEISKDDGVESASVDSSELKKKYGAMAGAAIGESNIISLENDNMIMKINTKGGKPHSVELKDYKTHDSLPLMLFKGDTALTLGFEMFIDNRSMNTNQLYFEYIGNDSNIVASENDPAQAVFRLKADEDHYIDYVYTLNEDKWMVDYDVKLHNMHELLAKNVNFFKMYWNAKIPGLERGRKWETQNTTIHYRLKNGDVEKINERKDEDKIEEVATVDWIAFKQQFFSSILFFDEGFEKPTFHAKTIPEGKNIEEFNTVMTIPYRHEADKTYNMKFYFGPNKYQSLKSYDKDLEKIIPLGWGIFGWFNKFLIIPVFNWLGNFIDSYGIIILLLTLIIKLILFPLTYKSYMSTAKMRVLKPQIEELSKKYPKGKEMEKQQATMSLYKKAGANPMGGCLPMLLQLPILIALFRFFPASIELRQQSFLWANDLSSYDSILDLPFNIPMYGDHISLFTLLMAGSMVVSTRLSGSNQTPGQNAGMMKMMMYFMPVMLLLVFNNYASGLSYYYFLANLITIIQTWVIRKYIVDDEAVMAKLEANKKKPKKKSRWQQKLEEAQKHQQKKKR